MRYKHLLAFMLLMLLAACGQKRALFLPPEPSETAENEPNPQQNQQLPKKPQKETQL